MRRIVNIFFLLNFRVARYIIYIILTCYYFYLVYVNTDSCTPPDTCCLCGMKTAVWELIHFRVIEAYQCNSLIIFIIMLCLFMLIDIFYLTVFLIRKGKVKDNGKQL